VTFSLTHLLSHTFSQVTVLRSAQALGLVCHLRNEQTRAEKQLQESNWSHQFNQQRFARLATRGVTLQAARW